MGRFPFNVLNGNLPKLSYEFLKNFWFFFQNVFFRWKNKSWEKKLDHHIYVELYEEYIFRNLGAILQSFLYDISWIIKYTDFTGCWPSKIWQWCTKCMPKIRWINSLVTILVSKYSRNSLKWSIISIILLKQWVNFFAPSNHHLSELWL